VICLSLGIYRLQAILKMICLNLIIIVVDVT